jgi:hypothetical protein
LRLDNTSKRTVLVAPVNELNLHFILHTYDKVSDRLQLLGNTLIEGTVVVVPSVVDLGTTTVDSGPQESTTDVDADLLSQPASTLSPEVRRQLTE